MLAHTRHAGACGSRLPHSRITPPRPARPPPGQRRRPRSRAAAPPRGASRYSGASPAGAAPAGEAAGTLQGPHEALQQQPTKTAAVPLHAVQRTSEKWRRCSSADAKPAAPPTPMPQAMQVGPLAAGAAAAVASSVAAPAAPRLSCCRASAVSSCSPGSPGLAAAPNWSRGSSKSVATATGAPMLLSPGGGGGSGGGGGGRVWLDGWCTGCNSCPLHLAAAATDCCPSRPGSCREASAACAVLLVAATRASTCKRQRVNAERSARTTMGREARSSLHELAQPVIQSLGLDGGPGLPPIAVRITLAIACWAPEAELASVCSLPTPLRSALRSPARPEGARGAAAPRAAAVGGSGGGGPRRRQRQGSKDGPSLTRDVATAGRLLGQPVQQRARPRAVQRGGAAGGLLLARSAGRPRPMPAATPAGGAQPVVRPPPLRSTCTASC